MKYAIQFHTPGLWCDGLYLCAYTVASGQDGPKIRLFDTQEEAEKVAGEMRFTGKEECVKVVEYNEKV